MDKKELLEFATLLLKLPVQKQKEFYFMIKGASFVAENDIA